MHEEMGPVQQKKKEVIRLQTVNPDQLLTDEEVLDSTRYRPFRAAFEREEPMRTFALAREKLSKLLQGPLIKAPLLMQTPRGLAAVWQVTPRAITVVLGHRHGDEFTLDRTLTVLTEEEYRQSSLLLDLIPLDLPSWSRKS